MSNDTTRSAVRRRLERLRDKFLGTGLPAPPSPLSLYHRMIPLVGHELDTSKIQEIVDVAAILNRPTDDRLIVLPGIRDIRLSCGIRHIIHLFVSKRHEGSELDAFCEDARDAFSATTDYCKVHECHKTIFNPSIVLGNTEYS
jgi:hypothetical protein